MAGGGRVGRARRYRGCVCIPATNNAAGHFPCFISKRRSLSRETLCPAPSRGIVGKTASSPRRRGFPLADNAAERLHRRYRPSICPSGPKRPDVIIANQSSRLSRRRLRHRSDSRAMQDRSPDEITSWAIIRGGNTHRRESGFARTFFDRGSTMRRCDRDGSAIIARAIFAEIIRVAD